MSSFNLENVISSARKAINENYGTDEGEYGSNLYVSHHLEELDSTYWKEYFGSENPEPFEILNGLVVKPLEKEEDLESIDFTLPGEITNYVLTVYLDQKFQVEEIAMES